MLIKFVNNFNRLSSHRFQHLKVLTSAPSNHRNYSISNQKTVNNVCFRRINPSLLASSFAIRHSSTVNLPGEGHSVLEVIPIQSHASTIGNEGHNFVVDSIPSIPEPPQPLPEIPLEAIDAGPVLNTLGEPTFASLGLGGWTPVGIVQNILEYFHVTLDIPWWGSIMIGTIIVRTMIFPLVIMAQRNAAKMNNNMPQMQVLQMKMSEARQSGNAIESARYAQEMVQFMREKELNPLKNILVPLAQMPLFISFFVGLRGMANCPVDSMRTGGMMWFTDLTVPDQFYLLPMITSATMYLTIELGTDSARLSSQNLQTMKYVLRALPLFILPFTVNFPGAILCYWTCSNFISLAQVGFLKIPRVRQFFKIDKMIIIKPDAMPAKKKGFVEGIKESWTNMKITRELEERKRVDEILFQKAGKSPIVKTYKYDPTKPKPSPAAAASTMQIKKR